MIKRKFVLIFIGMVCLVFLTNFFMSKPIETKFKETAVIYSEENAMTMKEAIAMGYEYIREISTDANLAMIMSADAKGKQTTKSGGSGKRTIWNLLFIDPKSTNANNDGTTTAYSIRIIDGKVTNCEGTKAGNNMRIEDSDLILDSSDAVNIAKNQKSLNPGKDWAIGYHFQMMYVPIDEKQKTQRLIIEVVGLSPNGNFAHVDIDEKTGQIVKAIEMMPNDDKGNATWKDF